MADGPYRFQAGAGQFFYSQHNQQSHNQQRNLHRHGSPVHGGRVALAHPNDTPSPTRSPGPQSPARNPYNMYNQGQHQNQHSMMNGAGHQRYTMQMNMGKQYQHQGHQSHGHHAHAQHQHQDHSHGGNYGGHQHTVSGSGMGSGPQHFNTGHSQNGTTASVHSGVSKPVSEQWALQLQLAAQAREPKDAHFHARNNASANKGITTTPSSASRGEGDKEERNRAVVGKENERQEWTALDFGGQGIRALSSALFNYNFLDKIYFNNNKLQYLPSAIGHLRRLTHLDLSLNQLDELPPEIGMLTNLKSLLLFDNNLHTLPTELGALYQLEILGIEGNPLDESLKTIIVEHGTQELIRHLRESAIEPPLPLTDRSDIILDDTEPSKEDGTAKFKVLSFNTLCDKYATQAQYGYTPSRALSWDYRKELILQELRLRNADIVCLQEIDAESFNEYFRGELAHNDYKGTFWAKSRARTMGEREARQVDGCATFYKGSKWILLDKSIVDFANTAINRPDMKGEHDVFNRVMPRDDIALVTLFEHRMTGHRLIVVNTHIFWNPEFKDVKVIQIAILMEAVTKLAEGWTKRAPLADKTPFRYTNGQDDDEVEEADEEPAPSQAYSSGPQIPLILCTDLNSTPGSGVYDLIAHGALPSDHSDLANRHYGNFTRDGMTHPFSLKSSYANIGELSFTNYTPGFTDVIDYIWYSTNTLQVTALLGEVDKDYLQRVPGFPNWHFPSDHLALQAEFAFKTRKEKKIVEADFTSTRNSLT